MPNTPNISVIVPVHNAGAYLNICLDSIVHQTEDNIEIICINDASTDNSLSILQDYAKRDKRITIIDKKKNEGVSQARNAGLQNATGKYIWFVDSDDLLSSASACKELYTKAQSNDLDLLCFCAKVWDAEKQQYIENKWYEDFGGVIGDSDYERKLEYHEYLPWIFRINRVVWNKLFKRQFLVDHKISFNPKVSISEDQLFLTSAVVCSPTALFTKEQYYQYKRDFSANLSGVVLNNSRRVFDVINVVKSLITTASLSNDSLLQKELMYECLRALNGYLGRCHKKNRKEFRRKSYGCLSLMKQVLPKCFFIDCEMYTRLAFELDYPLEKGEQHCGYRNKSIRVCGIPFYFSKKSSLGKSRWLLGLPIYRQIIHPDSVSEKVLGVPLKKTVRKNGKTRHYCLGICYKVTHPSK